MKEITLKLSDDDYKRILEIQAYMKWNFFDAACYVAFRVGIDEVEKTIAFDKEKKGK